MVLCFLERLTPPSIDPVTFRAAVLELLWGELEPRVKHFECVDHPDRLNRPDRCVERHPIKWPCSQRWGESAYEHYLWCQVAACTMFVQYYSSIDSVVTCF